LSRTVVTAYIVRPSASRHDIAQQIANAFLRYRCRHRRIALRREESNGNIPESRGPEKAPP
jgi:hypothetical protein